MDETRQANTRPSLVVHAGAWSVPDDEVDDHRRALAVGLAAGWAGLSRGGSALDAVVEAVVALEDHPDVNAGTGASLDRAGDAVLDAGLMDHRCRVGAVTAVRGVRNPIRLARRVLDAPEVILTGAGAERFAAEVGVASCDPAALVTERQRRRLVELGAPSAGDTVGAVAVDEAGRLASATSTGGPPGKRVGRVGDSAIVGAGFCVDRGRACSATGIGEAILRVSLARRLCDDPAGLDDAAHRAVGLLASIGSEGGVIVVDTDGRVAVAFNTPRMAYGWRVAGGTSHHAVANRDGSGVRIAKP